MAAKVFVATPGGPELAIAWARQGLTEIDPAFGRVQEKALRAVLQKAAAGSLSGATADLLCAARPKVLGGKRTSVQKALDRLLNPDR